MAYDEGLAERIRAVLDGARGVTEKKMFGGIAFLLDGKMFVGLATADLMVRVGPAAHQKALARPHARPMDFTGKPMVGYVYVRPRGLVADEVLARWVHEARDFVATLPAKMRKPAAKNKPAKKKRPAATRTRRSAAGRSSGSGE